MHHDFDIAFKKEFNEALLLSKIKVRDELLDQLRAELMTVYTALKRQMPVDTDSILETLSKVNEMRGQ